MDAFDTETPTPAVADDHGFPGCKPVRISRNEIVEYDGRIEYWDAETEIAMVCEPNSTYHEHAGQQLQYMAHVVAQYRGSHIQTFGTADLQFNDRFGRRRRIMQADQTVFLHPQRDRPGGPAMVVGEGALPDVVLEVDHTTDARRRKLGLYGSWGFPEVWIEVPDAPSASRSPRRQSGLTIHVAGPDGYAEAPASRAFPGLTAEEIHRALNEDQFSKITRAALRRVGRLLGEREGTTPDDDPVLREERRESHDQGWAKGDAHGHARGHAQGVEEGRSDGGREMLRRMIVRHFGADTAARLADSLARADAARLDDIADWVLECATSRELIERVADAG